jgi:hypothetical protein
MTRDRPPRRGIGAMAAITVVALAIVATAANAATAAQQAPVTAFITINPEAGFPLDPFVISLQAGGPVDASTIAKECKGFVARNPILNERGGCSNVLCVYKARALRTAVCRPACSTVRCWTQSQQADPTEKPTWR